MTYYIVKKGETVDMILNRFALNYQKFIALNDIDIKEKLKPGMKIKISDNNYKRELRDDINRIISENEEKEIYETLICPYCKNIIYSLKK